VTIYQYILNDFFKGKNTFLVIHDASEIILIFC